MVGVVDPAAEDRAWRGVLEKVTQAARWEVRDLLARRDRMSAADLLRGRSGELAASPDGFDQLLSVALDRAADDLAAGSRDPRLDLADFVEPQRLAQATCDRIELRAATLLASCESQAEGAGPRCAREGGAADMRIWADPRVLADLETRAVMLARARARTARPDADASRRRSLAGWLRRLGRDARGRVSDARR
jgi:hypothetical protein